MMVILTLVASLVPGSMVLPWPQAEAADTVKPLLPNPPVLNQAKQLIEKGDYESAVNNLRRFLTTTPRPEHLDDTYLLLGAALYGMKDYGEALHQFNQLHTEFPESELLDRSKLLLARTHAAMGNVDLALPLLTQVRTTTLDEGTKREAQQLSADLLALKKTMCGRFISCWREWPEALKSTSPKHGNRSGSLLRRNWIRRGWLGCGMPIHAPIQATSLHYG